MASTVSDQLQQHQAALPQVLILGAQGRLGYACVKAFAAAGWRVLAQVRPGSHMLRGHQPGEATQVQWVPLSLPQLDSVGALHGAVQVVVNAWAPKFSMRHWDAELSQLTQASLQLAQHTGALLIQPLSVLPWGPALPAVLYEDQGFVPAKAPQICALRARSEAQMRAAVATQGVRVCGLRMGTLYGHAGWGWISTAVAKDIKKGRVHWLGPYDVATP